MPLESKKTLHWKGDPYIFSMAYINATSFFYASLNTSTGQKDGRRDWSTSFFTCNSRIDAKAQLLYNNYFTLLFQDSVSQLKKPCKFDVKSVIIKGILKLGLLWISVLQSKFLNLHYKRRRIFFFACLCRKISLTAWLSSIVVLYIGPSKV